ncbi:MAG: glycosyltransferase [Sulfitobacter sp.]
MAGRFKVQIKGLVRFSYLSEGGFAMSEQGQDAVRDILYDPARLDRRFRMFESLALHSIKRQRNPNFKVGVLIGDSLPDTARNRLETLVKDVPQIQIISLPPLVHFNAVRLAYGAIEDEPGATHTATFRLDDDDAMHRVTTNRIDKLATPLLTLRDPDRPFAIAFNRGFYLNVGNKDVPISEWYEKTPLGVGLALVAPVGDPVNVFRRNHRKLGEYYDCMTEVERPMFIRSVHRDNDSGAAPTGRQGDLSRSEIARILRLGFGKTLEELKAL